MRKGAATTARALSEQATAADQIAKSATSLNTMIGSVNRAMSEQASALQQVTTSMVSMRKESEQAARAMAEQARALKGMTTATQNTSNQIKKITVANREHSTVAAGVLDQLRDIRKITDRNARDVSETRGNTAELIKHASDLTGLIGRGANGTRDGANGRG